jgi:hypothetical protein
MQAIRNQLEPRIPTPGCLSGLRRRLLHPILRNRRFGRIRIRRVRGGRILGGVLRVPLRVRLGADRPGGRRVRAHRVRLGDHRPAGSYPKPGSRNPRPETCEHGSESPDLKSGESVQTASGSGITAPPVHTLHPRPCKSTRIPEIGTRSHKRA